MSLRRQPGAFFVFWVGGSGASRPRGWGGEEMGDKVVRVTKVVRVVKVGCCWGR